MIFKYTLTVFVWLLAQLSLVGQDLFDYDKSKSFAEYLYASQLYNQSLAEYLRVVYLVPRDISSWSKLIGSYQHLDRYSESLMYLDSAEAKTASKDSNLGRLKAYGLLKTGQFDRLDGVLSDYSLTSRDEQIIQSSSKALSGNWDYFLTNIDSQSQEKLSNFESMALTIQNQKSKSRFLAGALSAVIPGSGKLYTGRWKDGMFSLLLVGATGWQAYRLISQKGITNFGSLVFGGVALGLYTGNVYGAVKSAEDYNNQRKNEYKERVEHLVDAYFGYD